MLTELFTGSGLFGWLPHFPVLAYLPEEAVIISALFSAVGAMILAKFTGDIGSLTYPLNFSALFIAAVVGNYLFAGMRVTLDPALPAPVLLSVFGMTFGGLSMLAVLRRQ